MHSPSVILSNTITTYYLHALINIRYLAWLIIIPRCVRNVFCWFWLIRCAFKREKFTSAKHRSWGSCCACRWSSEAVGWGCWAWPRGRPWCRWQSGWRRHTCSCPGRAPVTAWRASRRWTRSRRNLKLTSPLSSTSMLTLRKFWNFGLKQFF